MAMDIRRDKYLNKLIIRKHNGMVKIITGLRRSGKSYLLNVFFYQHLLSCGVDETHIIKFAFDSADDLAIIGEDLVELKKQKKKVDPNKFMEYIKDRLLDNEQYYFLLDEIQELDAFESVLNGYLRKGNIDIYVTGSNSKFLSSDILTEFEDRGDEIHVFPLIFSEYYNAFSFSKEEAFEMYSVYGGLPLQAMMSTDSQKTKYLNSLIEKTYLKDIIDRNDLKSDNDIGELLDVVASGIGGLVSTSKLESTFKSMKKSGITRATIDKYVGFFKDSFLISQSLRYDIKGRKYIGAPYKLYFEDIGLRNARIGFRQIESNHIMENIIYNELRYRGFNVDVGVVESREMKDGIVERTNYEVDFVATLGSKKYYIQSAYEISDEEKWDKETKSFDKIDDSFKKIVVVKNPVVPRHDEKGYLIIGIFDFLLDDSSLEK